MTLNARMLVSLVLAILTGCSSGGGSYDTGYYEGGTSTGTASCDDYAGTAAYYTDFGASCWDRSSIEDATKEDCGGDYTCIECCLAAYDAAAEGC